MLVGIALVLGLVGGCTSTNAGIDATATSTSSPSTEAPETVETTIRGDSDSLSRPVEVDLNDYVQSIATNRSLPLVQVVLEHQAGRSSFEGRLRKVPLVLPDCSTEGVVLIVSIPIIGSNAFSSDLTLRDRGQDDGCGAVRIDMLESGELAEQ